MLFFEPPRCPRCPTKLRTHSIHREQHHENSRKVQFSDQSLAKFLACVSGQEENEVEHLFKKSTRWRQLTTRALRQSAVQREGTEKEEEKEEQEKEAKAAAATEAAATTNASGQGQARVQRERERETDRERETV